WPRFGPPSDPQSGRAAREWGAANGIDVVVDHINLADLTATVAAEISAGSGHDLIEIVGAEAGQFEPSLLSLNDVNEEAQSRFGEQLRVSRNYSYNPATENYYSFCV